MSILFLNFFIFSCSLSFSPSLLLFLFAYQVPPMQNTYLQILHTCLHLLFLHFYLLNLSLFFVLYDIFNNLNNHTTPFFIFLYFYLILFCTLLKLIFISILFYIFQKTSSLFSFFLNILIVRKTFHKFFNIYTF